MLHHDISPGNILFADGLKLNKDDNSDSEEQIFRSEGHDCEQHLLVLFQQCFLYQGTYQVLMHKIVREIFFISFHIDKHSIRFTVTFI